MANQSKKGGCGKVFFIIALAAVAILVIVFLTYRNENGSSAAPKKNPGAEQALSYLNDIEEIKWVEIDGNNAYIGFDPLPSDWQLVIKAAAVHANKATDFGFHVWAVPAAKRGWRPGDSSYYGNVTARYGKIER